MMAATCNSGALSSAFRETLSLSTSLFTTTTSFFSSSPTTTTLNHHRIRAITRPPRSSSIFPSERDSSLNPPAAISSSSSTETSSSAPVSSNGSFTRTDIETSANGSIPRDESRREVVATAVAASSKQDEVSGSFSDYFEHAKHLIRSEGGPPRWFTPLDCGGDRLKNAPLLLYLPGIDGVGLGLIRHHRKLRKMFDIWCLHIPVRDRTSFADLVKLVEGTVRMEQSRFRNRPIYLVGESVGACLAMAVAARNPEVDMVLILANPATSFSKSLLQRLVPLLQVMPSEAILSVSYLQSLLRGLSAGPMNSLMDALGKGLMESQPIGDLAQPVRQLLQGLISLSSNFPVMAEILPRDTFFWKMELLKVASDQANSRLHAIKAQTMILASGRDPLLPSEEEGERLYKLLPRCDIRNFKENGHFLLLEDDVDLGFTIKASGFYRRGAFLDYVTDYVPPTPSDVKIASERYRLFDATSPVMFSTLEDGQIVRGLSGYPTEGPVLLVGYHMLMGFELYPLVTGVLSEKNILVRGIAHPMMFLKPGEWKQMNSSMFDSIRVMGAVPVSGTNLFKLLYSKSHVLLYPGGVREALHRKGEEYQLFWPERSEFVRMAARFGAKIVPFGVVGEDDITELVVDYNDQMRIPYIRDRIQELTAESRRLRNDDIGEVANQDLHLPGIVPKPPGRLYYLFGKPIETAGRKQELKDREKAQELYLQVKSEVETCLAYLKEKRKYDPYRSLLPRMIYQAVNGTEAEIPTFDP